MDDIRDLTDNRFRAQIPTFEEAQLLITKRVVHKSKMIEMERLSPMKTENDQTIFFFQNPYSTAKTTTWI